MMEYKGYIGKVEFDDDADIFHGEVVGIRDVITFQGKSVKELRKAFEGSVNDYLEFCEQRQEEPEKPCSGKFVVRLKPALHRYAAMVAQAKNESLNTLVSEAVEKEVQNFLPELKAI